MLAYEIKGLRYRVATTGSGGASTAEVMHDAAGQAPEWGAPAVLDEPAPAYLAGHPIAADAGRGELEAGARAFDRACSTCHGENGQGSGANSDGMDRINAPAFLALTSDQALRRIIITGRPDLGMPSYAGPRPGDHDFQPLTPPEISALGALLASWREGAVGDENHHQHQ